MRLVTEILAWIVIAVGLLITILPTPFGFLVVAFGLALLTSVNPRVARWLKRRFRRGAHAGGPQRDGRLPGRLRRGAAGETSR